MADRTINFGVDETEATYQIQDDDPFGGGNFKINDTDAATAIFEYDQANSQWILDEIQITAANVDTLNGADVANAPAETVPVAQGDGTLAMQEAGADEGVILAYDYMGVRP